MGSASSLTRVSRELAEYQYVNSIDFFSRVSSIAGEVLIVSIDFLLLVFQQLEIDYVIGESHKEILSNRSGPAAIIRIFGVTREGLTLFYSFL